MYLVALFRNNYSPLPMTTRGSDENERYEYTKPAKKKKKEKVKKKGNRRTKTRKRKENTRHQRHSPNFPLEFQVITLAISAAACCRSGTKTGTEVYVRQARPTKMNSQLPDDRPQKSNSYNEGNILGI